jgi:hypothetical protein
MDLSILQEDSDNKFTMTMLSSEVVKLRGKNKQVFPVFFPLDHYLDHKNCIDSDDPAFLDFQKEVISLFFSPNGHYFLGLVPNGDFKLYFVDAKSWKKVKGLPYFSVKYARGVAAKEFIE